MGDPVTAPKITLPRIDDDDDRREVTLFDVERHAVGELSGEAAARVQAALDADPTLAAVHAELVAADRAFLIEHPAPAFLARLDERRVQQTTGFARVVATLRSWVSGPLVAAAAAASVVLFVVVQAPDKTSATSATATTASTPTSTSNEATRSKGGPAQASLSFFVQNEDGSARVGRDGEVLHGGDRIQFVVTDLPRPALVIVGLDGTGHPTVYATEDDATRTRSTPSTTPRALASSLVLDDSRGAERFFVVWGDDAHALAQQVNEAAAQLAARVHAGGDLRTLTTLPLDDASTPQASTHIVKAP
jgi:hypothetical protein